MQSTKKIRVKRIDGFIDFIPHLFHFGQRMMEILVYLCHNAA